MTVGIRILGINDFCKGGKGLVNNFLSLLLLFDVLSGTKPGKQQRQLPEQNKNRETNADPEGRQLQQRNPPGNGNRIGGMV